MNQLMDPRMCVPSMSALSLLSGMPTALSLWIFQFGIGRFESVLL
jgi:hypothetical protein